MRLVIISDTHIPERYDRLSPELIGVLKKADLIVHAGDFTSLELYNELRALGELKAVSGNMDVPELAGMLRPREVFSLKKFKLGLIHGSGSPERVVDNVRRDFGDTYDLVIFGHTHAAFNEKIGRTLYFNPGSPTDKIFAAFNSYGIIEIDDSITAKIIKI